MDASQESSQSAPRRSQREHKQAKPDSAVASSGKRKRGTSDDEEEEEDKDAPSEDENQEDYEVPKAKSPKKPVAKKDPKPKPAGTARRPRGRKLQANGVFDAEKVAKETKINTDNPLFNAIMNPSAALQGMAEDFLEAFSQDTPASQAELVNLVLRACGCNDTVDGDMASDTDGVQSSVDDFIEALKQESNPTYPLTSKNPVFKKFRASLTEFISRLVISAADQSTLYSTDLVSNLATWIVTMSSAPLRNFRHTATVVALDLLAALCDVAHGVEKEEEVLGRQREGEKKRKAKGGASAREKELAIKSKDVKKRKNHLSQYMKEIIDGVFMNRYRDLDPIIRTECITSLGIFIKKYPSHFLNNNEYLRYIGWVLSDADTHVRLAAVKALQVIYSSNISDNFLTNLNHFTERFKPRLTEMAEADVDLSVRVGVLSVLEAVEKMGMLGDEDRERLGGLVYCSELRVRKAVAGFVRGVWEEWVEDRETEMSVTDQDEKDRIGLKGIAALLGKWGEVLDEKSGEDQDTDAGNNSVTDIAQLAASRGKITDGRISLAAEALWDELDAIRDWNGILEVLILDHSDAAESQATSSKRKGKKKAKAVDDDDEAVSVSESWRLEEGEEGILLNLLITSIIHTKKDAVGAKKGEEEAVTNEITRALMKAIPRLFVKYHSDENRIKDVLALPMLMNLELYLEMRAVADFTTLWDDVLKQFLSHSSPVILQVAMGTISILMAATALSNTNSAKILELEDELSTVLRDSVSDKDEIETATFSEDELRRLGATCLRLGILAGARDLTSWMEESEGGKQSSAWELLAAIAERGRIGYAEEEMVVEQALHLMTLHIMWKGKGMLTHPEDEKYRETLVNQRGLLLEKLTEFAVGAQANTVEGVKRVAFKNLLHLHVLFSPAQTTSADGTPMPTAAIALSMEDETQYRCAGYIQSEIERYAETSAEYITEDDEDSDEDSSEDDGERTTPKPKKGKKVKKTNASETKASKADSRGRLEKEYVFIDVITTFLRATRAGAISVHHTGVILAHYGRLGPAFNLCTKPVIDLLREEGMYNENGDMVVAVVHKALQEACSMIIDSTVRDESNAVQLAKQLSTTFLVRGTQLAVVRRLDVQYVVEIHEKMVKWIVKRAATYSSNSNQGALKRALLCFRPLTQMLATVQTRDALSIKAYLDQTLAQAKLEVGKTATWEPLQAYERKLALKDKDSKALAKGPRKARGKGKKVTGDATDEESEVERMVGMGDDSDDDVAQSKAPHTPKAKPKAKPRPKPQPTRQVPRRAASNKAKNAISDQSDADGEAEEDEMDVDETQATPKARPKPRLARKTKSAAASPVKKTTSVRSKAPSRSSSKRKSVEDDEDEDEQDEQEEEQEEEPEPAPVTPPRSSRKRSRDQVEEEEAAPDPMIDDPPTPEEGYIRVNKKKRAKR